MFSTLSHLGRLNPFLLQIFPKGKNCLFPQPAIIFTRIRLICDILQLCLSRDGFLFLGAVHN